MKKQSKLYTFEGKFIHIILFIYLIIQLILNIHGY